VGARVLDLDALDGIFVRLSPQPPLPDGLSLEPVAQALFTHERREGLHHLLQTVKCAVVNRPSGGRANASKPLQMSQLRDAGFTVPPWIVTNSADAATAFAGRSPGDVIYKATSGLRSRVRRVDDQLRERLAAGTTPTVIQAYIPGRDVRVHTVGARAFATEMVSEGVDYRFVPTTQYRPATVGRELAERCCETARSEGLMLAGFDFRVTPDNEWYCLEMNPVPSFLPYEMCSGEPIGDAVLDLFTADHGRRSANLAQGVCSRASA
jgi:glutathione synthase/RimK-type ligase-like ATP-grasp enzyme